MLQSLVNLHASRPLLYQDFALMLVYKDLLNLCLSTFFVLFRILELGMSRHVQSHLSFQYKPTEFPTSTGNSLQLSIFFFSSSYSQGSPLLLQHVTLMFGTTKNSLQTLVSHLGGKGGGISGIASGVHQSTCELLEKMEIQIQIIKV